MNAWRGQGDAELAGVRTTEELGSKDQQGPISRGPLSDGHVQTFLFLFGLGAFLYLNLFIPPATPLVLGPDGPVYLMNASRMLKGQVIYRDFFQFTPPRHGGRVPYFV